MEEQTVVKHTCIQSACFHLPFFEAGEWRRREKSPWKSVKKIEATPDAIRELAAYTQRCMEHSAAVMEFLLSIHDDWEITVKKDGVWMETETMMYEDILPKLEEAGISENDYALYSEYTRKCGMI